MFVLLSVGKHVKRLVSSNYTYATDVWVEKCFNIPLRMFTYQTEEMLNMDATNRGAYATYQDLSATLLLPSTVCNLS